MIINDQKHRTVDLTKQQTEMCMLMVMQLQNDDKINDRDIGYVSVEEFKSYVSDWHPKKEGAIYYTSDAQVMNQISKIKTKLEDKGYSTTLINAIEVMKEQGDKMTMYRLDTLPNNVDYDTHS